MPSPRQSPSDPPRYPGALCQGHTLSHRAPRSSGYRRPDTHCYQCAETYAGCRRGSPRLRTGPPGQWKRFFICPVQAEVHCRDCECRSSCRMPAWVGMTIGCRAIKRHPTQKSPDAPRQVPYIGSGICGLAGVANRRRDYAPLLASFSTSRMASATITGRSRRSAAISVRTAAKPVSTADSRVSTLASRASTLVSRASISSIFRPVATAWRRNVATSSRTGQHFEDAHIEALLRLRHGFQRIDPARQVGDFGLNVHAHPQSQIVAPV